MSYNQNFAIAIFFFAAILFLYPFVSPTPLYHQSAEKTTSLPKFMCHGPSGTPVSDGQSRTPVPTIANILMRTLVKAPFFKGAFCASFYETLFSVRRYNHEAWIKLYESFYGKSLVYSSNSRLTADSALSHG